MPEKPARGSSSRSAGGCRWIEELAPAFAVGGGGQGLGSIRQVAAEEPARSGAGTLIVDVRGEVEWRTGHIPNALLVPLPELPERLAEIPADRPVVLHCGSGGRSSVAASLLHAAGRRNVSNLAGGIAAWMAARLPVESG